MTDQTDEIEMIGIVDAAREANVHPATLRRRLAAADVPVFAHPEDWRRRLIRYDDFTRIGLEPRPVGRPRKEKAAAA